MSNSFPELGESKVMMDRRDNDNANAGVSFEIQ
jgi:hypothetical protein